MNLREKFKQSKNQRARDLTIEGIGDFKLLIPSAATADKLRLEAKGIEDETEWLKFIGKIVAQYVVDEDRQRAYGDEEVPQLLEDLDTGALIEIFRNILAPKNSEDIAKNSQPTQSGS